MIQDKLRMANVLLRAAQITCRDDLRESLIDEAIGLAGGADKASFTSVEAFIVDKLNTSNSRARAQRAQIWEAYQRYCLDTDRLPLTRNAFYAELRKAKIREVKTSGGYTFACEIIGDDEGEEHDG